MKNEQEAERKLYAHRPTLTLDGPVAFGFHSLIDVYAVGNRTAGGANRKYVVRRNKRGGQVPGVSDIILFQTGDPSTSINGTTNEVLLAIVADRLDGFQQGPSPCQENENALNKIREALEWLHQRTKRLAKASVQ